MPIEPIILGKIGSCYGIKGWLKIFSFTENAENIFKYSPWFVKKNSHWQNIKIETWRQYDKNFIFKIKDINDRNTANLLTNCKVCIDSTQLFVKKDEYYWKDLMGCQVITSNNCVLGSIVNIIETGSNDVIVVKANLNDRFGIKERLIPFLYGKVIKTVDLFNKEIKVDWDPNF